MVGIDRSSNNWRAMLELHSIPTSGRNSRRHTHTHTHTHTHKVFALQFYAHCDHHRLGTHIHDWVPRAWIEFLFTNISACCVCGFAMHCYCLCRNLPFDCVEEDISDTFAEFGDIVYCRQVINRETDIPKGKYLSM